MRNIIVFFVLIFAIANIKANDCLVFFPQDIGTVLIYHNYDGKGNLETITHYKVIDKQMTSDGLKINVETKILKSEKDKDPLVSNFDFYCKDGVFYWNMQAFLNPESVKSLKDTGMEVKMEVDDLAFPSSISVDQKLPDGYINFSVKTMFMTMELKTRIYNRTVDAKEIINVKAGSYNAYKISQDAEAKVIMSEVKTKSVSWVAENIGTIKNDSYDEKGKLMGSMELVEIRK